MTTPPNIETARRLVATLALRRVKELNDQDKATLYYGLAAVLTGAEAQAAMDTYNAMVAARQQQTTFLNLLESEGEGEGEAEPEPETHPDPAPYRRPRSIIDVVAEFGD